MDLIATNAKIVREVAENVAKHSPDAVIIVVSNPLDEMAQATPAIVGERLLLRTESKLYSVRRTKL